MTDGREPDGQASEGQGAGGFRWNLTPAGSGDERPRAEPNAPEAPDASASTAAPVDDWDTPTAASPIIARSVFPLGAPSGPPVLLPPPYRPPPTLPPPLDAALEGVTEALGAHPVGLSDPVDEGPEASAIDVLFGESRFIDYDAGPPAASLLMPPPYVARNAYVAPSVVPPVATALSRMTALSSTTALSPTTALPPTTAMPPTITRPPTTALPGSSPRTSSLPFDTLPPLPASAMALYEGPRRAAPRPSAPRAMPRPQKILLWVAGALVACLALIALFLLGMRIGQNSPTAEQAAVPTSLPRATIAAEPAATAGPLAPGDYSWDELLGGECLTLFESPWQDTHTVVDCAEAHTGQMLSRVSLPDAPGAPYPTPADLQSTITGACAATTVLDYAAAATIDDIQLETSYPPTAEQWNTGERTTYCFVTRAGGGDLLGSLAVPTA